MEAQAFRTMDKSPFELSGYRFPVGALTSLHRDTSDRFACHAVKHGLVEREDSLVAGIVNLIGLGEALRQSVLEFASTIAAYGNISDNLAEAFIKMARQLGEDASQMRSMAAEDRETVEERGGAHSHSFVLACYKYFIERTEDTADLMEDVAETLALAAHRPFRELVREELEAAGVE